MLRVAVPNKGSLADEASRMLRDAGYRQRSDNRDLSLTDEANGVQFFYLRPKDIATYVSEGQLHLGITGHDLTEESSASVNEVLELGFGASQFRYAAPIANDWTVQDLAGKRIATSFPRLVRANLARSGSRPRTSSASTAPWRCRSSSRWPTPSPTSCPPAGRSPSTGSRRSGTRS